MFKKYRILLLLFPLILNAGLFDWVDSYSPKAQHAKDVLQGCDALIEQALIDFDVPGIAVGVVVDGEVVYAKGFGYRDVERKLPVTTDTIFAIGSCTKAFTGFLMGQLVDEGVLHWDEPVIDVISEFRLWDQYATTNLTIRDLLTHRSGLPRHEFFWYNSKMSKEEMLKRIRYLQPSYDFRERYQYGNLMYFTAGLALERATGKTWEQLIKEKILDPLNMTHTNVSVDETCQSWNYAHPYITKHEALKKIPYRNLSLIGPAGGINSNIDDMLNWIKMLLNDGVWKDSALISPVTLQEIETPQVIIPGAPETEESKLYAYGIGWGIISYRGHYYVTHDGVSDGFVANAGIIPSENIGLVILSNKNMTSLPRYLSCEIVDRILEIPNRNWLQKEAENIKRNKDAKKNNQQEEDLLRKKGTHPSHPLEDYVGLYEHPGYGRLTVDLMDDKLQVNYNDLIFILDHWHYDVFSISEEMQDTIVSFEGTKFTFNHCAMGNIGEVKVPFEPTADDIIFKRIPEESLSTIAHLRRFLGTYEIYGYTIEIVLRDNALFAIIPGQPNYELVPIGEFEFTVKEMVGSNVRFVLNGENKVEEVLLIHPYGSFSATPRR